MVTNRGQWVEKKNEPVHAKPPGFDNCLGRRVRRFGCVPWRMDIGHSARAFCAGALLALSFDAWVMPFQLTGDSAQAVSTTFIVPTKPGAEPVGLALPDCTVCHGSKNFSTPAGRDNKPSV